MKLFVKRIIIITAIRRSSPKEIMGNAGEVVGLVRPGGGGGLADERRILRGTQIIVIFH